MLFLLFQVNAHIRVRIATNRSHAKCCSNNICGSTLVRNRSRVAFVEKRSPTGATWRSTCDCILESSHTLASCAPRPSQRNITSKRTWTTTLEPNHTHAANAGYGSVSLVTWGLILRNAQVPEQRMQRRLWIRRKLPQHRTEKTAALLLHLLHPDEVT